MILCILLDIFFKQGINLPSQVPVSPLDSYLILTDFL
jgi:hypothetical protein